MFKTTLISRRALLWLVPLVITLHIMEELAGIPAVLSNFHYLAPDWLIAKLPPGIYPPGYQQFVLALLVVTVLPYLFVIFGRPGKARGPADLLLSGVMLVNMLSHLFSALFLDRYVPGLVTSVGIILPFGLYFFQQGLHGGWLHLKDFTVLLPLALVLHGPGLFGLMGLTAWLTASL